MSEQKIIKLQGAELKVMNVLWSEGDCTAKHISNLLAERIGWNMNTTYTLIKRCIKKGAIERSEPNFMCHALVSREVVQETEANELLDKLFAILQTSFLLRLSGEKIFRTSKLKTEKIVGDFDDYT